MFTRYWDASDGCGFDRVLYQVRPLEVKINQHPQFREICNDILEEFGVGYVSEDNIKILGLKSNGKRIKGRVEGGRATTIDKLIEIDNQEFKINIKGSSARFNGVERFYFQRDKIKNARQRMIIAKMLLENGYIDIISDSDYGDDAPHGGQNYLYASDALELSDGTFSKKLGMHICPVLMATKLDKKYVIKIGRGMWNYKGEYGQDIRLVPSNIRVQKIETDTGIHDLDEKYLEKVESDKEEFKQNLITSFVKATFLSFRTLRKTEDEKYSTYLYENVDPLKDGNIAGNGTLYFSDLEGIVFSDSMRKTDIWEVLKRREYDIEIFNKILSQTLNKGKKEFLKENINLVEENLPKNLEISIGSDGRNSFYTFKLLGL